ncbi:ABC-type transport system involved in multi-copper enzyme maturation [Pseudomonas syringae pv. actinidiae]|uniref:ABC-type transport system involved in multi-copper enzyme maturation n=1 Tax=Pseudomonas syringae pv. actinidiae TaxID=103796 RepID=A0AAN4TJ25_PSESF|nr:ABC-type transport system involved in multi-copper enzyme maturation [Pseudomonas syringae pv. actinidiae]
MAGYALRLADAPMGRRSLMCSGLQSKTTVLAISTLFGSD